MYRLIFLRCIKLRYILLLIILNQTRYEQLRSKEKHLADAKCFLLTCLFTVGHFHKLSEVFSLFYAAALNIKALRKIGYGERKGFF